jgi:hypothetical protein
MAPALDIWLESKTPENSIETAPTEEPGNAGNRLSNERVTFPNS